MSKQAEEFFRQEKIKQAKSEKMKKFLALVNYEKEAEIMQKYTDEQLRLYVVSQRSELVNAVIQEIDRQLCTNYGNDDDFVKTVTNSI